jgi:hypothetical protein
VKALPKNTGQIFLGIVLSTLSLLLIYLVYKAISLNYLPIYSDEYGYYLDAKSFWLYGRIDAATTLNERFSLVGHAGFHGFVYSVLYGTFFKLFSFFGISPSVMLTNIILAISLLILLALTNISLKNKMLIGIVFMSNFILIVYLSSGMAEIFHYVFAFVVGYLLYRVYETRERKYLYSFIALIVLLSFFRQSWIFVLFGLFPLANSLKDFVKYSIIFLLGLIFVVLDIKLFHAPFPFGFFQDLSEYLQKNSLADTINKVYQYFLTNIDRYFLSESYGGVEFVFYYKYLFVALLLYSIYSSYRTREKTILSGTLIAAVIFFALLTLYDAYGWREVRMLSVPFMILTVILILNKRYLPVFLIILFQLFTLNSVLDSQKRVNFKRENMNILMQEYSSLINDFSDLGKYVTLYKKKEILVLLNSKLFSLDNSPLFYQLPLSLNDKYISYSFIFGNKFKIADSQCDLFISDKPEKFSNMELVGNNKNYYFYRRVQDGYEK